MNKPQKPVIVVHGGAGAVSPERDQPVLNGIEKAAIRGYEVLEDGGGAVDSVMEAVIVLEDDGTFNAGIGACLNIIKEIEMDASIMDGKTLQAGAVALVDDVKNPVRLARIVMEKTDHVFIAGKGAGKLADMFNLERRSPITEQKLRLFEQQKKNLLIDSFQLPKLASLIKEKPEAFECDTVGAVALDKDENVAAATSTGGFRLKLPGRIGDSALIGCGNYADNEVGACSATGVGEMAIRLVLAKAVLDQVERGKTPQQAAEYAIKLVNRRMPDVYNSQGLVALDVHGRIGAAHNSPNLSWCYITPETRQPVLSLTAKLVKEKV